MAEAYVVVVAHNVVCLIERIEAAEPVPATPLEVSSQLAANYRRAGCIDGRYLFDDAKRAKAFASLCLGFTKALIDKRLAAIEALPAGSVAYRADDQPEGNLPPPGPG